MRPLRCPCLCIGLCLCVTIFLVLHLSETKDTANTVFNVALQMALLLLLAFCFDYPCSNPAEANLQFFCKMCVEKKKKRPGLAH